VGIVCTIFGLFKHGFELELGKKIISSAASFVLLIPLSNSYRESGILARFNFKALVAHLDGAV
jgi:hypothetical protein